MSGYDLVSSYTERAGRAYGAAMDWEALGLFHRYPEDYHFTKRNGLPDKRYKNYPEVLAYWSAEQEERSRLIDRAMSSGVTEESPIPNAPSGSGEQ
jgi:hypothetical protein